MSKKQRKRRQRRDSGRMVCELRPLDGGEEAEEFAGELGSAVCSYLRSLDVGYEISDGGRGSLEIRLNKAVPELEDFAGVHRVQRQPTTGKGKRHTSTVSLAVVTKATSRQQVTAETLRESELDVSWYRGSGPGGQHRNTSEQAVRMRHIPTGEEVRIDGRSRSDNLEQAKTILAARLEKKARRASKQQVHRQRLDQTGMPVDGGKDFTWNWQRSEVVDHNTGRRWRLKDALRGKFDRGR